MSVLKPQSERVAIEKEPEAEKRGEERNGEQRAHEVQEERVEAGAESDRRGHAESDPVERARRAPLRVRHRRAFGERDRSQVPHERRRRQPDAHQQLPLQRSAHTRTRNLYGS